MQVIVFFLYYSWWFHRVCNCTKQCHLYFVIAISIHLHRGWLSFAWFDARTSARPTHINVSISFTESFLLYFTTTYAFCFLVIFCFVLLLSFFFFFSGHIFDFRRLTIKSASLLPPAFSKKNNRHYFHMTVTYRQDHDMMFLIYNIFIYLIFFLYFWHFLSSFFFLNVFLIFFSCLSIDIWSEWQLAMMFGYL